MREKRGLVFVRCSPEDGKGDEKVEKSKETVEETYERSLRSIGVDNAAAKKILDTWKESGSDNPDALRRLFLKGSLRPLGVTFGQALLDLGAVAGALSAANAFSSMDEFPFKIGVEAVCYFVGFYFLSNLFFDAITLSVVVYSTVRFGTNTEAYLAAVERIAGDFGVVNKAQAAVDAIKVVQALNTIAEILQVRERERERVWQTTCCDSRIECVCILTEGKDQRRTMNGCHLGGHRAFHQEGRPKYHLSILKFMCRS